MFSVWGRLIGSRALGLLVFHLLTFQPANTPVARSAAPFRGPALDHVRRYQFTARIKANAGVSPFKVGSVITGRFTYDLKGKNKHADNLSHAAFESARNAFTFQAGDLGFSGAGEILVTTAAFKYAEHFQIVAFNLNLPMGWEMNHAKDSQSFSFLLQNAPAKRVLADPPHIPNRLSLPDFVNTRELRLDFFHGVRWPGGQVNARATVLATVESLEEVGN